MLDFEELAGYVERFNADDEELYANIPNREAFAFLKDNVPLFDCPDEAFERTYHFRWWTYRKHIKKTDSGYVVTEFLPKVSWSGKHNTIVCPVGHQFYEGRWLHNPVYLDDYAVFWMREAGRGVRSYSNWLVDSLYARHLVSPNEKLLVDLLPDLVKHYETWEKGWKGKHGWIGRNDNGLYFSVADRDGMEVGIGGNGFRPTQNSYRYGDALAIASIARMAGDESLAASYVAKAKAIKQLVQDKLWDEEDRFFKVLRPGKDTLEGVREQLGYTPWYFNLPDAGKGYETAWEQITDPQGFYAPFGPTTAEQRDPRFIIRYEGHECQWNGPSWPLSTSVTLTALANVLNDYDQDVIDKQAYFDTLSIYTNSHQRTREDGKVVPWIDENLNPFTGDWISRTRLKTWKNGTWDPRKGGKERGKDYNHSSYNDLIITGLVGLRPRPDDTVEVNPLLPDGTWDYFCLDNVRYRGHTLTILWDKTGERYGKGKGLTVLADGRRIAHADTLTRITGELPNPTP
ncbi:MAG: MGH1-like glycoside hydrolase domain-containing protein [Phycisphaeraceae bacterium]